MYDTEAVVDRGVMSGERRDVPSGEMMRTGSTSKGTSQYSENMATMMLTTMSLRLVSKGTGWDLRTHILV